MSSTLPGNNEDWQRYIDAALSFTEKRKRKNQWFNWRYNHCRNCGYHLDDHLAVDGQWLKCLYGPGAYQARG